MHIPAYTAVTCSVKCSAVQISSQGRVLTQRSRRIAVLSTPSGADKENTSIVGDQQTMLTVMTDATLDDLRRLDYCKFLPLRSWRPGRRGRWRCISTSHSWRCWCGLHPNTLGLSTVQDLQAYGESQQSTDTQDYGPQVFRKLQKFEPSCVISPFA